MTLVDLCGPGSGLINNLRSQNLLLILTMSSKQWEPSFICLPLEAVSSFHMGLSKLHLLVYVHVLRGCDSAPHHKMVLHWALTKVPATSLFLTKSNLLRSTVLLDNVQRNSISFHKATKHAVGSTIKSHDTKSCSSINTVFWPVISLQQLQRE